MGSGTNWGQNGVKAGFAELQNDAKKLEKPPHFKRNTVVLWQAAPF